MTRRRDDDTPDAGVSLIEVVVTLALTSVLGMIIVFAVQSNSELHRDTIEESTGLADVKVVVERLGRDIRAARSVDPAATRSRLELWIDSNANNSRDLGEEVTWEVVPGPSGTQYNVLRQTTSGQPVVQAQTVVDALAFCYWEAAAGAPSSDCSGSFAVPLSGTDAAQTRLITTTLTYDATTSGGTSTRTETFSSRLRNAG
ncbi:MAG: Prepilin-type N-terminal cleavage/methylation protein [Actinomycetota bacterium]|nr:Prepilin-type N-terminal cleavage/methylation protein [Actinomycetota bacterium]